MFTKLSEKNSTIITPNIINALIYAVVMIGCLSLAISAAGQTRVSTNRLVQQSSTDAANVMFRSARDLITDQKWAQAQERFEQYVKTYPNEKNIDAALYWLAYSENKLAKFDDCRTTINRLLQSYPETSWREDARVLWAQLPGTYTIAAAGVPTTIGVSTTLAQTPVEPSIIYAPASPDAPVALAKLAELDSERYASSNDNSDDPCEFKIVVLQALFQTDPQRGIVAATEWLKPNSGQTVRCKGAALTLLGRNGGKAVTPIILGVARSEPDLKLRARAISALGSTNDDTVIDALRDFALNSQENDIVEASLYALSRHSGDRAMVVLSEIATSAKMPTQRKLAISSIASRPGEPAVDALLRIYDAEQTLEIRKSVIYGFGNRKSERAGAKLLEIARGTDPIELRKAAISALSRRGGDKVVDNLLSLYDSEKNEELRDQIMSALGSGSIFYVGAGGYEPKGIITGQSSSRINDQRVVQKLIDIARDPHTPMERRKRAIGWLTRSKDPKVLAFLEDLLK